MGAISAQELQAWLQPGGDSNSGPILAPQRLFEFDSNNDSSPSHSNLVSDRVYICSCLIPMVSWWVPYLPKGCRPDFNNGLGGDSNSGPVLAPGVYLSPTRIMAPLQATPILCQMKSIYLFKSPIYDFNTDVNKLECLHLHENLDVLRSLGQSTQ